jgi:hypothetical protein
MASERVLSQSTVYLQWYATDSSGDAVTGKADLEIAIRRRSDGFWFDFDGTLLFIVSGSVTTRWKVLTEIDATNAPGMYSYTFDMSTIANAAVNDEYEIIYRQNGGADVKIPAPDELLVDQWPAQVRALLHGHVYSDNFVYDANGFATSYRLRLFDSLANTNLATDGGSETGGLIGTVTIAGTPDTVRPTLPTVVKGTLA